MVASSQGSVHFPRVQLIWWGYYWSVYVINNWYWWWPTAATENSYAKYLSQENDQLHFFELLGRWRGKMNSKFLQNFVRNYWLHLWSMIEYCLIVFAESISEQWTVCSVFTWEWGSSVLTSEPSINVNVQCLYWMSVTNTNLAVVFLIESWTLATSYLPSRERYLLLFLQKLFWYWSVELIWVEMTSEMSPEVSFLSPPSSAVSSSSSSLSSAPQTQVTRKLLFKVIIQDSFRFKICKFI